MCIIIYKPAGAAMPSKKLIKRLFNDNPDGGGYMYADGGNVTGKKGYMTFRAYWNAIERDRKEHAGAPWVFHMRIATHGGINPRMCHPFPVSASVRALTRCEWEAAAGVAHNGIISMTAYAKELSDTQEFIRSYAAPLLAAADWKPYALELIEEAVNGSRLAFMDGGGRVELLGTWHEHGGLYFSNEGYKEKPAAKSKSGIDWDAYYKDLYRLYHDADYMPHSACWTCEGDACTYCERDGSYNGRGNAYDIDTAHAVDNTRGGTYGADMCMY